MASDRDPRCIFKNDKILKNVTNFIKSLKIFKKVVEIYQNMTKIRRKYEKYDNLSKNWKICKNMTFDLYTFGVTKT